MRQVGLALVSTSLLILLGSTFWGVWLAQQTDFSPTGPITNCPSLWSILRQNSIVALFLLTGIVTFGITTLYSLLKTGLVTGLALGLAAKRSGWINGLRPLLSHSVFELLALGCFGGVGFSPLMAFVIWMRKQRPVYLVWQCTLILLLLGSFALVAAGIVEAKISCQVIKLSIQTRGVLS